MEPAELTDSTTGETLKSFSDHHALVVEVILSDPLSRILSPKGRSTFRLKDEVISDAQFQLSLSEAMLSWQRIKSFGLDTMQWWEVIVKPGIRRLGMARGKQLSKERKDSLNLLLVRQAYLNKKVKLGHLEKLGELLSVHHQIQIWYQKTCDKVKAQSWASEF